MAYMPRFNRITDISFSDKALEAYKEAMAGIYTTSVNAQTLVKRPVCEMAA